MDNLIFIDIETRYPQRQSVRDYVKAHGKIDKRLKDPKKIAAARKKLLADTPLNPMWGEVAVIAWNSPAMYEGPTAKALVHYIADEGHFDNERETAVLVGFNLALASFKRRNHGRMPHFVGFNVQFDLRFIWTRMLLNGIKPAVRIPYDAKPWSGKYTDLRYSLTGGGTYAKGTLQDWCVAFGQEPRANDIPGHELPDAIEAGRMAEVIQHCEQDVRDCVFLWECINGDGQ